ncbi:cation efflux system protein CzcB [Kozakia baliensis NRIC 0488]|uniref:Uncharacterized protein n=2 Tax=Kozakia baliensis TaxID=153496 RepID=A0A1D8UWA2_9PROT|nr:hypothetical protein A0U89_13210 [Kozakia baliensis]GBR26368.1 cation efflux system protein CzcB [Kozakia baliensis NRIC 0488]
MHAMNKRRLAFAGAVALVLFFVIIGVVRQHKHPLPGPPVAMFSKHNGVVTVVDDLPLLRQLNVAPVTEREVSHGLEVPGTVQAEPNRVINMSVPVGGRVLQADIHPGQIVHRGETLAILASGDFDQAYADLTKARAQTAYEDRVVKRAQNVLNVGGNAAKDLEAAKNDAAQAQAELQRAEHRLEALNARPDLAARGEVPLVSPVDGVVSVVNIAQGENITDTTAVQLVLFDLAEVQVEAAVPESNMSDVKLGHTMRIRFDAYPDRGCAGPIFSLEPNLRADTRRMIARVACSNPDMALRPNMFANATIDVSQPPMIMVPKTALLMNNDKLTVFVEIAPRQFRRRLVDVSYDEGESVRVLSGLKAGERVVTRGAILLNDDDND